MPYELRFTRDAEKGLAALPKADAQRIFAKLVKLAEDPGAAAGVKKLEARGGYRLRAGDFRALFLLDHGKLIVTVTDVANRKAVYRRK